MLSLMDEARKKIHLLFCGVFACCCLVVNVWAGDVTVKPFTKAYDVGGMSAPTIGELIESSNSYNKRRYDDCVNRAQASPNNCFLDQYTGAPVKIGETFVGEEVFDVPYSSTYWNNQGFDKKITVYTTDTKMPIRLYRYCPNGYIGIGRAASPELVCVLREKKSCSKEGNPIDVGSGRKFEYEVDFSSADGNLKLERFYINQAAGWSMDEAERLTVLQPGESVEAESQYSVANIYTGYCFDVTQNNCTDTRPRLENLVYINRESQLVIYLAQGRQRIRFSEVGGAFKSDDLSAATMNLARISPVHADGASWKLVKKNGDILYYLASGQLLRVEFFQGGSLTYQYTGALLRSKTDHNGRSLIYGYDSYGRLVTVTQPDQQVISYQYGEDEKAYDFTFLKKVTWPNGESIGYIYSEAQNIAVTYSTRKELTGKLDTQGNRIGTYKYSHIDAISTEGALGTQKRTIVYGVNPVSASVTDSLNSTRRYVFTTRDDGSRLVLSTNQPAGSGCDASSKNVSYYPESDLKKYQTDFNGHQTQYAYDIARKLETVRVEGVPAGSNADYLSANALLAAGVRKITTEWHGQKNFPVRIAEPRLVTTLIYNGDTDPFNGNSVAQCAPSSQPLLCHKIQQATTDSNGASGFSAAVDAAQAKREWLYTYNEQGQLLTRSRAVNAVAEETREYYQSTSATSTKGDLKKITNALGQHTDFTHYDANGRVLRMLDINGVETQYSYDLRGRLASQAVAGAAPTSHSYDLNGNRIQSVLPNGVALTYGYDIAKRLTSVENARGDKISYEYDLENNLRFERVTNASGAIGYIKEHIYDALSREKNTLNSFGQSKTNLYDANGNLTGKIDAKQQVTMQSFDALNQLKVNTDALDGKTDYSYDGQGRITQVKDARGNITSYAYNAFGDLLSQSSPDTGTTTFSYDAIGNRTGALDARAVQVQYNYDALNRLTFVKYPAASIENVIYSYDDTSSGNFGVGRLTGVISTGAGLAYSYNAQGLISQKIATVNAVESTTQYVYDLAGNILSIIYPSGRVVNYTYDAVGRVQSVKTKETLLAAEQTIVEGINYLPFGPASNYTFGNGLSHSASYDNDYRLTGIQVGGIFNRGYSYDPVDNISGISNLLAGNKSQSFTYDAVNRLVNANGIYGTLAYTYDAVGNRTSEKTDSGTTHLNDTYSYSPTSNRLTSISKTSGGLPSGARSFNYDEAGNRIQGTAGDGNVQSYTFNKANRLETARVAGILAGTYAYNALGQRVSKTLPGGSKEIYHYDEAGQLIAVTDAAGNSVREYIYMGNQLVSFVNIE